MWAKLILGLVLAYLYIIVIKDKQFPPDKHRKIDISEREKLHPPNVEVPQPPSKSTLHTYPSAAVCSDKSECSHIGRKIMEQGGNAVDAAIATLLCNGVVTMQSMGLGGGAIMTYYSKEKNEMFCIMGRERAPLKLTEQMVIEMGMATEFALSPWAIAVPGEVAAYSEAHTRFGLLPWKNIVQPTVNLCYKGYRMTRHQRDALFQNEERIRADAMLSSMFIDPDTEEFYSKGSLILIPFELCETYVLLARDGAASFYNGTLATLVVMDLRKMASPITLQDLREYKADVVQPLQIDLGDHYVLVPPPPASGHVLGFVLQILRNFKDTFGRVMDFTALDVHRIVEALKFGFVKRWEYDATFEENLDILISRDYGRNISQLIDDLQTFTKPTHYGANGALLEQTDYGTAHISVLAPNGDAVSVTSSLNYYFGSGHMGHRSGVLFNNAISDFNIGKMKNYFGLPTPKQRNTLRPKEQPMSSAVPLIVIHKDSGDVRLVTGAAGGSRMISTLAQILVRVLWMNRNVKQAIDYARFHHQLLPNRLEYEFGLLQQVLDDLLVKGHKTKRIKHPNTAVCAVERVQNVVQANVDYRKDGGAVDGF